jgi:hypothetical protein
VSENRAPRRIFGSKRERERKWQENGDSNKELHNLYTSSNGRITHNILSGKCEGKYHLGGKNRCK